MSLMLAEGTARFLPADRRKPPPPTGHPQHASPRARGPMDTTCESRPAVPPLGMSRTTLESRLPSEDGP